MKTLMEMKKQGRFLLRCGGVGLILAGGHLRAQTYSVDWFKLAGGGGTSTSAVYAISATIAQHDAGKQLSHAGLQPAPRVPPAITAKNVLKTSADYSLIPGFWAIYALQIPGAPRLRIVLTETNTAVVAWPAPSSGWTLQLNTNLDTIQWRPAPQSVEVIGGENQIIVSPPLGDSFFRLYFQ